MQCGGLLHLLVLVSALMVVSSESLDGMPAFTQTLGEAVGKMQPNQLAEQNTQLLGAMQAIEQGTPPPGMESMMGGASSQGGEVGASSAPGGASGKASAISEGIKMAMKSVKPLMDKYVATARALTNKYTVLKKRYKDAQEHLKTCPDESSIKQRIEAAVAAAKAEVAAGYKKQVDELKANLETSQAGCKKKMEDLAVKLAKAQQTTLTDKDKFAVELSQAKQSAKTDVQNLHTQLKEMMMSELKKRENRVEKEEKKEAQELEEKAKAAHAKKMREQKKKKEKRDKDLAAEKETKAEEKQQKAEEAKEARIKNDAAEEARQLNRKTVTLKAREAVHDARIAARMARKMSHDADTNLENARLRKAKKVTEDDIKALSKLRHHEDLARVAVDSANEKREKISRYEYAAKRSLHKSEQRTTMLAKKNRWEERRIGTLSDIANAARDNAEVTKAAAEAAAANAGLPDPGINLPLAPTAYNPKSQAAAEKANRERMASDVARKEAMAHEERKLARKELKKAGVPIPDGLEKGQMAVVEKKVEKAEEETKPDEEEMRPPGKEKSPDSTEEGHKQREGIRKHTAIEAARLKTKIARVKLNTALVKRSTARQALRQEGQPIPENLKKGGLDSEKAKLEDAARRAGMAAEQLKQEEESATNNKEKLATEALEKVEEASEKRQDAREYLRKEGKPIPENLEKGGLDKEKKQIEADKAAAEKGITAPSAGDTEKTAALKQQSTAVEAELKAETGVEKTKLATALRDKAREALKDEKKEIPESLSKNAFESVRQRAHAALATAKDLKKKAAENVKAKGVGEGKDDSRGR